LLATCATGGGSESEAEEGQLKSNQDSNSPDEWEEEAPVERKGVAKALRVDAGVEVASGGEARETPLAGRQPGEERGGELVGWLGAKLGEGGLCRSAAWGSKRGSVRSPPPQRRLAARSELQELEGPSPESHPRHALQETR
jgi:hypothetical protein